MARKCATTAERDTLMAAVASADAEADKGPLWTQRQVDQLLAECNKLVQYIAQAGVQADIDALDLRALQTRCRALAACSILVKKGICTEAELNGEIFSIMLPLLRVLLQAVEEHRLRDAEAAGKVVAVRHPRLLIAEH